MRDDNKYNQGRFHPLNPEKYKGNSRNIIYRSSWELKFMKYCDRRDSILEWGSEEFFIPYLDPTSNPPKVRRYFPDFIMKVKESDGSIKTYVIEIKPEKQTKPPSAGRKKSKTLLNETITYEKNKAKWKAAKEFCEDRRIEFKIITERDLGIKY